MTRIVALFGLLAGLLLPAQGARAHEVRPGFLELRETDGECLPDDLEGTRAWRVPARHGAAITDFCHLIGQPTSMQAGGAFIEHGRVSCDRGLAGQTIAIDRLDAR